MKKSNTFFLMTLFFVISLSNSTAEPLELSKSDEEWKYVDANNVEDCPLWNKFKNFHPKKEKHFVIFIGSYNNARYYKRNLDSVFGQKYKNYSVIYIDDVSTDGTADLVEKYIRENGQSKRTKLIRNRTRIKRLANTVQAAYMCKDDDIILDLGGDDWLAHDRVLSLLNRVYQEHGVWVTLGEFIHYPDKNKHYVDTSDLKFRQDCKGWAAPRTFYCWLFKKIKLEDLLLDGKEFFSTGSDIATIYPMLEMAGNRFMHVTDVLYVYNYENPLMDPIINKDSLFKTIELMKQMPKYDVLKKGYKKIRKI
jgi:glycosyltransferase involved in cell wall biosynthesis